MEAVVSESELRQIASSLPTMRIVTEDVTLFGQVSLYYCTPHVLATQLIFGEIR